MKMFLEIYRNGEKVNEITETDPEQIYKKLAEIMLAKEYKRASRTRIDKNYSNIKIIQTFDQTRTQLYNISFKYIYNFDDVIL